MLELVELRTEHVGYLSPRQNGPILIRRAVRTLGGIDTVKVNGKDYPVRKSGAVWTTQGRALTWYVATMDHIVQEVESKAEAIFACTAALDGRKHPTIQEITPGFYEYIPPSREECARSGRFIGTHAALLRHAFDYQLREWQESEAIPNKRSSCPGR